jgi:hypothetical protein
MHESGIPTVAANMQRAGRGSFHLLDDLSDQVLYIKVAEWDTGEHRV